MHCLLYTSINSYSYNSLYWIYRSLQNSHEAWRSLAISFCVGLVLLAAWFVLRKERYAADQAIAKVTFHIWTELRFLAVFLCLLCLTVPMLAAADGYLWWYPDDVSYTIMQTLRCFGAGLFNPGAALGLCLLYTSKGVFSNADGIIFAARLPSITIQNTCNFGFRKMLRFTSASYPST